MLGNGISSLFGGSSAPQQVQQPEAPYEQQQQPMQGAVCDADQRAFMKCLDSNQNDISACQFYLDMLKQCQSSSKPY
jgi:coiled-coil-helix-coiled-coil-helix domain-containing protein 2